MAGAPELVLDIRFGDGGAWHRPLPFRLRLLEGDYTAQYDPAGRLLTVAMPPGRTARLRLSSLFENDPDIFGIMGWCRQELDPASADAVYEAIRAGTHWMTAPWRDIVLVHAVQRPLEPAQLELELPVSDGMLTLARNRGATAAELVGRLFFDLPSTAQLDVSAAWEEARDDPEQRYEAESDMVRPTFHDVFSLAVPEPFGTPWLPEVAPLIEPLDERVVGFRTRGREDETPEKVRLALRAAAQAAGLPAPERRRLEAGAAQLEKLRAHEFGDTRYRRVTYRGTAATRFREYFDPAMPAADGSSAGEPLTVDVLSSAPPAKPVVLQVLPLMRYDQSVGEDGVTTSRRESVGLRVWLNRPWWSAGAGELLAVMCDRGGPHTPDTEGAREISLILQDPAHASKIPQPLTVESFRNALPSGSLRMATFRPAWDAGRQAWYCDLEFRTGTSYFPFVRLALARYQPKSILGCELSPIVSTAFVQTVADRTLTCTLAARRRSSCWPDRRRRRRSTRRGRSSPAPTWWPRSSRNRTRASRTRCSAGRPPVPRPSSPGCSPVTGRRPGAAPCRCHPRTAGGCGSRCASTSSTPRTTAPRPQALVATRRLVHADVIPLN